MPPTDGVWAACNLNNASGRPHMVLDMVRGAARGTDALWILGREYSRGDEILAPRCCARSLKVSWPKDLTYLPAVHRDTLDCELSEQLHFPVNLSAHPDQGFKHTELLIDSLPCLRRKDAQHLIGLYGRKTHYLGAVCTVQDVRGLILHRVQSDYGSLVKLLDMHTRMQVHSFVPRTFALHCVTMDNEDSSTGVFVGESPGFLNLGCSQGSLVSSSYEDTVTLTYYVLRCLLRVQIVTLRVLGFTMKRLQPARIWRVDEGLRVDVLACLIDTLYVWEGNGSAWGALEGLAAIWETISQLNLCSHVPNAVAEKLMYAYASVFGVGRQTTTHNTPRTRGIYKPTKAKRPACASGIEPGALSAYRREWNPTDDEALLHEVYNLCGFSDNPTGSASPWEDVLGAGGQYESCSLPIDQGFAVQPYGPFYIQIQNQIIKWNRAIIVEPCVLGPVILGQLNASEEFCQDTVARALIETFYKPFDLGRRALMRPHPVSGQEVVALGQGRGSLSGGAGDDVSEAGEGEGEEVCNGDGMWLAHTMNSPCSAYY